MPSPFWWFETVSAGGAAGFAGYETAQAFHHGKAADGQPWTTLGTGLGNTWHIVNKTGLADRVFRDVAVDRPITELMSLNAEKAGLVAQGGAEQYLQQGRERIAALQQSLETMRQQGAAEITRLEGVVGEHVRVVERALADAAKPVAAAISEGTQVVKEVGQGAIDTANNLASTRDWFSQSAPGKLLGFGAAPNVRKGIDANEVKSLAKMNQETPDNWYPKYDKTDPHNPIENKLFSRLTDEDKIPSLQSLIGNDPLLEQKVAVSEDLRVATLEQKAEVRDLSANFNIDESEFRTRITEVRDDNGVVERTMIRTEDRTEKGFFSDSKTNFTSTVSEKYDADGRVISRSLLDEQGTITERITYGEGGEMVSTSRTAVYPGNQFRGITYEATRDAQGVTSFKIDGREELRGKLLFQEPNKAEYQAQKLSEMRNLEANAAEAAAAEAAAKQQALERAQQAKQAADDALLAKRQAQLAAEETARLDAIAEETRVAEAARDAQLAAETRTARIAEIDELLRTKTTQGEVDPDWYRRTSDPSVALLSWLQIVLLGLLEYCGHGDPDDGERLGDAKKALKDAHGSLEAATAKPGQWSGAAATLYNDCNAALMEAVEQAGCDGGIFSAAKSLMSKLEDTVYAQSWQVGGGFTQPSGMRFVIMTELPIVMVCETIALKLYRTPFFGPTWCYGFQISVFVSIFTTTTKYLYLLTDNVNNNAAAIKSVTEELTNLVSRVRSIIPASVKG